MKKASLFIFTLLLIVSSNSMGQNYTYSNQDTVLNFISDWSDFHQVEIVNTAGDSGHHILMSNLVNGSGDTVLSLSYYVTDVLENIPNSVLYGPDSITGDVSQYWVIDSFKSIVFVKEYDTLSIYDFLDIRRLQVDTNYKSMLSTKELPTGSYTLSTQVCDTNFVAQYTISASIYVDDKKAPSLLKPHDHRKYHTSDLDTMTFKFNKKAETNLYYRVQIASVDSVDWTSPLELVFADKPGNIVVNIAHTSGDPTFDISQYTSQLQNDQWYAWTIRAFRDPQYNEPIPQNSGYAIPFTFAKTTDTSFKKFIRRAGGHPWECENYNSGFEDGTTNGWRTFYGKRTAIFPRFLRGYLKDDNIKIWSQGGGQDHHRIVGANETKYFNIIPKVPRNGGNFAFQIGSQGIAAGGSAEDATVVSYTFTPEAGNAEFTLRYLYFLEDGEPILQFLRV